MIARRLWIRGALWDVVFDIEELATPVVMDADYRRVLISATVPRDDMIVGTLIANALSGYDPDAVIHVLSMRAVAVVGSVD